MDKKTAICDFLKDFHRGREKAICSKELQRIFSLDGRNIRRKISRLRQEGYPICSDETGYFYAARPAEVRATIAQLSGRITKIDAAKNGMLKSYRRKGE